MGIKTQTFRMYEYRKCWIFRYCKAKVLKSKICLLALKVALETIRFSISFNLVSNSYRIARIELDRKRVANLGYYPSAKTYSLYY